ncbi:hypothetical protein [Rhodococcus sp. P14]|uniref:hypothetical protein n=1 Tax=Rhodococcus sp. P14 TaxID=450821 RepID=UPI0004975DF9|nr:hypothetical protein [Rhodococcus sp. P14]
MLMRPSLRRLAAIAASIGAATGLTVLTAPTASAATFTRTIGLHDIPGIFTSNTGSAGNITPLINAAVYLRTDPAAPPLRGWTMDFDYCPCTVHWRNTTTGATGTAAPFTDLLPNQTGSGTITATVTIDGASITLQSGTATWHAP